MRKRCEFSGCNCDMYEGSCMHCNHGMVWHKNKKHKPNTCIICYSNPTNCLLLPCKHFMICSDCSNVVDKCPYCVSEITDKITGIFTQ